jgi:putative restriction endonuclease
MRRAHALTLAFMARTFGHIEGYPVGSEFVDRAALSRVRLHGPTVAGIWGSAGEGAESIVVNGGYEDDVDYGDLILYTGEGGKPAGARRQQWDQEFTKGNAALRLSSERQYPVRVVRGPETDPAFAPTTGYRYDGLFLVQDAKMEQGLSGFQICRFVLRSLDPQAPAAPAASSSGRARRQTSRSSASFEALRLRTN